MLTIFEAGYLFPRDLEIRKYDYKIINNFIDDLRKFFPKKDIKFNIGLMCSHKDYQGKPFFSFWINTENKSIYSTSTNDSGDISFCEEMKKKYLDYFFRVMKENKLKDGDSIIITVYPDGILKIRAVRLMSTNKW